MAALRAALAAAEDEAAATGALSLGAWRRCSGVFASLSSLWAHARDAESEAERDAHELFRRRVKGPTAAETLEADDEATEQLAYERAFGRHGVAFADLRDAPDAVQTLGDDDDVVSGSDAARRQSAKALRSASDSEDDEDDAEDASEETKARVHAARLAGLLEGDLLEEVVAAHRRLLGGLRGPPAPPPPPPAGSTDPAVAAAAAADPGGWWAVSGARPAPKKYGGTLFTREEATRAQRFERAHDAGVKVAVACGADAVPRALDAAAATGALLRAALECAAASRPAVSAAEDDAAPRLHLVGVGTHPGGDAYAEANGDDDDESSVPAKHDAAADAAADALGADLNEGGCAGEMALVVAPVAATRAKITALLAEWPDHPLLSQLGEICDRIVQLPLMSPLKQALTGLELLLARAQTWEEGAAAHVSLKEELAACAKLALRWRQRELRTWPRLLARAQERHVARAHRAWFALHRLLRPVKSGANASAAAADDANVPETKTKTKTKTEPFSADDPANLRGVDASGLTAEERESLRQVTLALEEYVQGSTIGEFRARLDLLWQFHADMAVEAEARAAEGARVSDVSKTFQTRTRDGDPDDDDDDADTSVAVSPSGLGSRERALSSVLYNTWRYYAQFAPAMQRRVEAARQPAAKKLRDHARLAKWEDRGYHAMKTSGEANQRSMHKFVRAFDVSLNALALPALQAANATVGFGDLPSERSAADRAAFAAAAATTAREAKRAAILAKNAEAEAARREHKMRSAGESVAERARRAVREETEAAEAKKKAEADRKKAVADAFASAFASAENAVASERAAELDAFAEAWRRAASHAARDAVAAGEITRAVRAEAEREALEELADGTSVNAVSGASFAALKLDDRKQYQSRLDALTKRVASVLGSAFTKLDEDEDGANGLDDVRDGSLETPHKSGKSSFGVTRFARGAVDVDAFASAVASRCVSLREDAHAKKATKKKAFVDLLKALPDIGVRSARKAVPESQRDPESWFREPPLRKPACFFETFENDETTDVASAREAFDAADAYYYRSMARAQRLRDARGNAVSGDVSARELDAACGSVEHLLFTLRKQRRAVGAAADAEARFAECARALDGVKRDVFKTFKTKETKETLTPSISLRRTVLLPRQASTKAWTLRQRRSLDTLLSAAKAARLVHKAVANAEPVPELRPGGVRGGAAAALTRVEADVAAARAKLDAHVAPALACSGFRKNDGIRNGTTAEETESSPWRVSACALATGELRETLRANFAVVAEARAVVEGVFASAAAAARACHAPNGSGDADAFAPLPGWEPLRALLREGAEDADAFAAERAAEESAENGAPAAAAASAVAAAAERFAAAAEAGVGAALVWAQTAKRASEDDSERPDGDDETLGAESEAPAPTMVGAERVLRAAMSPAKLCRVAKHVEEACAALAELTDAAHGARGPLDDASRSVVAAASARAAELAPLLALLGGAFRRAFAAYLHFHRASAKLEAVLSSLAAGVCLEGFCARPDEEEGGEGEDGKMMDDVAGTGMGAGEGKKDVSDEIEDEEQILGLEDTEKANEDEKPGDEKTDDAKGIEMQNDFEADARDLSDDEKEDEENDNEDGEENGDDIEKEMGDGEDDANAEVIDEKVWDQEDEDEEKDKPEEEKNDKQDKYEKGSSVKARDAMDTETRAADEDDDDEREDRDKDAEKDREDKKEDASKDEKDEKPPEEPAPEEDPNENDEPKDENDGVNREEIEENHGVAPKGAEGSDGDDDDDELDLPDDMQLDGEDEAGGAGDEGEENEDGDDGQKMDDDADGGEKDDGPGDGDDADDDDDADGGELDRVMEEVEGDEEKEEGENTEEDENAGGAAEDDPGAGEDDEGVQGGPTGAGAGGGLGDDDDENDRKTDAGDRGGDAGAGAEGDSAQEDSKHPPERPKAPAPRFEDADFDGGDDDMGRGPDQNQSALEAPGGGGEGGGGGASASAAGEGAAAPMPAGAPPPGGGGAPPPPPLKGKPESGDANPHRSLGDALKGWRERLSVIGDAVERENAAAGESSPDDASELPAREYEFERDAREQTGDGGTAGDDDERAGEGEGGGVQALAGATKEQAAAAAASGLDRSRNAAAGDDENGDDPVAPRPETARGENEGDAGGVKSQDACVKEEDAEAMELDADPDHHQDPDDDDAPDPNAGKSAEERGAARARRKGKNVDERKPRAGAGGGVAEDPPEGHDAAADADDTVVEEDVAFGGRGALGDETVVALESLVLKTSPADAKESEHPAPSLSPEDVEAARTEASAALSAWRERAAGGAGDAAAAQELWSRLELLTGSLSGELAEQLRLILEPTMASRLTGDFRTGKRLNMRKIIPYIASDFRKDKIWLRRSKPSQRKYQVVLAIDDSKSMAENQCGHLALESAVLIARAMARLEVGEIGVVSFGAGGSPDTAGEVGGETVIETDAVRTLHPLGAPFVDQGGPALVSQFTFAQDNTLADQPVARLLTSLDASLEAARAEIRGGSEQLQQLCLIIADGRFHEKEVLRRHMREMSQKRGLLVAFIVLDNPKASVLDMQTVSFANGKPEFAKYLDTFPFPFYTLVQDIAKLPAVISDLLRQWFEITAGE